MRKLIWVGLITAALVIGSLVGLDVRTVAAANPANAATKYTVRNGDCLSKIAARFHVSVIEIKRVNGLKSDRLRIGQVLRVPGTLRTAARARTATRVASRSSFEPGVDILDTAKRFLGVSYNYGGESPQSGFDCSGFTQYVFGLHGISLPRSSSDQWDVGTSVERSDLSPGDLVFFNTERRGKINHVGIYLEGERFIHASQHQGITITSMDDEWYKPKYVGARRTR